MSVGYQPPPGASTDATGLAALRAIRDGDRPQIALAATLGFRLVEADPGWIAFEMQPGADMVNSGGIVHGGVLGLVLDQAIGDAVRTLLPDGVPYVTLDLYLTYLRPVRPGTAVRCEAWVTHFGRRTARTAGRVLDGSRTTCECMSTLFIPGD